ncbi:hypothetical protein DS843_12990 [Roseomonas genomospecies 6]|uniref:Transposase DDE domain-containing protein n=1 Tax=Roseomonas genomospecies 6 TaxID=214106 RepID=A0A9W7NJT8_9PROT|nr:hypothetical protein DS843_12990 [Roseomonas genomospecies 6]
MLEALPAVPAWIVIDRGYASDAFRRQVCDLGARPAVPARSNEAPAACPTWIGNNRNLAERLWARQKEWRAIATRCEKTAVPFMGVLNLAAALDWLMRQQTLGGMADGILRKSPRTSNIILHSLAECSAIRVGIVRI